MNLEKEGSFRKIIKSSAVLLSGNVFASFLGVLVVIIITKNISLEDYGHIVMIQAYVMLIDQLFNFQSWQALIKYGTVAIENRNKNDLKIYIQISILLDIFGSLLAFSVALLLLFSISELLSINADLLSSYILYSIIILFRIVGTSTALLRLSDGYKYFNYQLIINWTIKLILVAALSLSEIITIKSILIAFIIGEFVSSIYFIYQGIKSLNRHTLSLKNISESMFVLLTITPKIKRFLLFSFRSNLNSATLGSMRTIDELMIGVMLSPASAAVFKMIKLIGSIFSKVLDPLYVSIYPELSKLVENDKKNDILFVIKKISGINLIISFLIASYFYLYGAPTIEFLFTKEYLIGLPVMQFYLIGIMISFVLFYSQPLMLAYEFEGVALIINLIASVMYVYILFIFTPLYGLWAIASSFLIYNIMTNIPKIYYIQRKIKLFTLHERKAN